MGTFPDRQHYFAAAGENRDIGSLWRGPFFKGRILSSQIHKIQVWRRSDFTKKNEKNIWICEKQNSTYEERTPPEGSNISIFTSCSKIMLPVRKSAHMQYIHRKSAYICALFLTGSIILLQLLKIEILDPSGGVFSS